jgi:methylase of polypeptide subunit release factors
VRTEAELTGLALALGARQVPEWSAEEERLAEAAAPVSEIGLDTARERINAGEDPLGEAFCDLRSVVERRSRGATYTPPPIVAAMTAWARANAAPARVVDAGVGSGRFLVASGRAFSEAALVGIEIDPLAALLARAHLASAGMAARSRVLLADYRAVQLERIEGQTLFTGNPPYVRHHLIDGAWKEWLTRTARGYGLSASQLAGLHVHFFLSTIEHARAGDRGVFITAAEWLDVNYGTLVRELLLHHLGGTSLHLIEPAAMPFPDAATTAVITCFEVKKKPRSIAVRRVDSVAALGDLSGGQRIRRERLEAAHRWGPLLRPARRAPEGYIELGELCRVHRGQVTGANRVWIEGAHSRGLPTSVLYASVTRARELLEAGEVLADASLLRRVIDLPVHLDVFSGEERKAVDRFLRQARRMGADKGFIAERRRAWWSVGLREPAPILSTYMARRPPAFVRNLAGARNINIAHGLYPREPLSDVALGALARYLASSTSVGDGRTYAGGLTKFEPREMERLLVPDPRSLEQGA